MNFVTFAFLSALAASACLASEHWTKVKSGHFELYTEGSESAGRDAVVFFERVRSMFESWNAKDRKPAPVRIVVFRSDEEYRLYQPNPIAVAYFVAGSGGEFIVTKNLSSQTYPQAVHEYVHLVIQHSGLKIPLAMNEGLAEFYSTLKVTSKGIDIGTPPDVRVRDAQSTSLMPLAELLSIDRTSPAYRDGQRAATFYAESWALTHMLLLSPEYRTKSPSYIRAMQAPPDPLTALERTAGKPAAQILVDLEHYVHQKRFVTALLDAKLDPHLAAPEVRPASAFESGMALANLLESMGRVAEAKERYALLARPDFDSRN
jgi:hypothetical protein